MASSAEEKKHFLTSLTTNLLEKRIIFADGFALSQTKDSTFRHSLIEV